MAQVKLTITLSQSKNHLLFNEDAFDDDGIATTSKVGSKRVDPTKAHQALEAAKKRDWMLVGEPINGFYEVEEKTAANAAASADQTVADNELVK